MSFGLLSAHAIFLSTPSARRATCVAGIGVDHGIFLSTPSARRATVKIEQGTLTHRNFYPRPPRGGRHFMQRCGL